MVRMLAPRLESAEAEGAAFLEWGGKRAACFMFHVYGSSHGSLGHIHVRRTPYSTSSQFLLGPE